MLNPRFQRTEMLLGESNMQKLFNASVMIIGVGAVGGYALEAFARCGIGHFTLVDFDIFEESNINRQILALTSTIGQKKIEVARERIHEINPDAKVKIIDSFINYENISQILEENHCDIVVDAIDALNPKCDLIEHLYNMHIPFISSMGAALKTDSSKIKYGSLSNSKNCHLAKFIRKRLRKRGIDISKINAVWSEEQINLPDTAIIPREESDDSARVHHTIGSLPTITAIFGLTIANQIILKLIHS